MQLPVAAMAALVVALLAGCGGLVTSPSPSGTTPAPDAAPSTATPSLSPAPGWDDEDTSAADLAWIEPKGIQVYAGAVSVLPGEPIPIMVSTPAPSYSVSLGLVTAAGTRTVFVRTGLAGRDERSLVTIDPSSHAVRAGWPVALSVPTVGFQPGIYILTASDSAGTSSHGIVVVRSAVLDPGKPAFVYNALTQAAYNRWGGYSFYRPNLATEVSFDRPLWRDGLGVWTRFDSKLVPWLLARRPDLQFTTDYDLGTAPPGSAPRTLILGFHTEYVPAPMRDWIRLHLDTIGDMNLAILGANSFYWRVRMEPSDAPGLPATMVCYKLHPAEDPLAATSPTGRYRDLGEPEGAFLGSQYLGVVFDGSTRADETITSGAPSELLAGTGWQAGTILHGILFGEGDGAYAGMGSVTIATSHGVVAPGNIPITPGMTVRVAPSGARIFDAGTFAFADGLAPARIDLGVRAGSFDVFARNVLRWLGIQDQVTIARGGAGA